jgi:hypothetical protein
MLGGLVEIFGSFVREVYIPIEAIEAQVGFPPELHDLRDAIGHHLIALLLLARCDREFAQVEYEIIVTHCMTFAQARGVACDERKTAAFRDYAASFRPSLMQLDPALAQFSKGGQDEFAALIGAARELVAADGVSRPEEIRFLAQFQDRLAKFPAAP